MERIGGRLVYRGKTFAVREDTFRLGDGDMVERQIVHHPGSVVIAAHDGKKIYLVRQPREAVTEDALLELPAGKLDVEGETELEAAKRELAEEVGVAADRWRELKRVYTSPGFASERVTLFEATGLSDASGQRKTDERIEIVERPLAELDATIAECEDSTSIIALMMLRNALRDSLHG
jgi:ADP-ribose pyrophosphatase